MFYENEFVFDPTPGWEINITGADDDGNGADEITSYMAGSVTSKMAHDSATSNKDPESVGKSNMAADITSNMAADKMPSQPRSPLKVNTDSASTQSNITDSTPTLLDSKTVDSNTATRNETLFEVVSKIVLSQEETNPLLPPRRDKHRSVTIHETVTEISESTTSSVPEQEEQQAGARMSSSFQRRRSLRESFSSSIQHVSKEIAFFRKKLELFTVLAFVLYCGQNAVLQFCTSVPLTFLPEVSGLLNMLGYLFII